MSLAADPSRSGRSTTPNLIDTRAAATTVVAGFVLSAAVCLACLVWWLDPTGDGARTAGVDEFPGLLSAAGIAMTVVSYVGWLWWSVVACVNARRIRPLAGSPLLPIWVYVGGPLTGAVSPTVDARFGDLVGDLVLLVGGITVVLGHVAVIASLRSTARRVGAATAPFSRLIWVPIAYPFVGAAIVLALGDRISPDDELTFRLASAAVVSVVMAALWSRATRAFDMACRSDVIRRTEHTLPSGDVIAAALRRSMTT